ncbi:MAG: hypothetical protein NVS3B18_03820 [Candidatus Dormibacteria bacterium]
MTEPTDHEPLEDRLKGYLQRFTSYPRPRESALDTSVPAMRSRGRRLRLIAAVAALAVCVMGTATAALVVTLQRGNVNGVAVGSTPASSGHSFFIPFAGPGATANGQGTAGGPVPNALSAGQGASAALPPLSRGGGVLYPWNSCAGSGSAVVANGAIQVQGMATVGAVDSATVEQLTIQVSGSGTTNKAAVIDAQAREVAVNTAMQNAGIPSADITLEPVQIGQNGYVYYVPGQPSKPLASGVITVSSNDAVQLGTAADAAQKAGGSQVSSYGAYGAQVSTPSSSDIATALRDATAAAHDEAVATASASGLRLGKVAGLTSSPPSLCYGASGEQLVVTVVINYVFSS